MGAQLGNKGFVADINVTPFVDVMLVLLIIFMVTAPLLVSGVPVELPESRANPQSFNERPRVGKRCKNDSSFRDAHTKRKT